MRLPESATVQDYVIKSGTNICPHTIVKVNGEFAGMDTLLRDGDSIEIIEGQDTISTRHEGNNISFKGEIG